MTITSPVKFDAWIDSVGPGETIRLGERLGRSLRKGDALSLEGELGSGKTTFVKGLAKGLGIKVDSSEVVSPTFVFIKEYPCRIPLFHLDLYRLDEIKPSDRALIEECFEDGASAVEWGDKAPDLLPKSRLRVEFRHAGPELRQIRLSRVGGFK